MSSKYTNSALNQVPNSTIYEIERLKKKLQSIIKGLGLKNGDKLTPKISEMHLHQSLQHNSYACKQQNFNLKHDASTSLISPQPRSDLTMQNKLRRVIRVLQENSSGASALNSKFPNISFKNLNQGNWPVGITQLFCTIFPHSLQTHNSHEANIKHPKYACNETFNCTQLMHTKHILANLKNVHLLVFLEGVYSHQISITQIIYLHHVHHPHQTTS